MMSVVLETIRQARERGGRSVILVPEASYEDALIALTCAYQGCSGRTAWMPDGNLVTVVNPKSSMEDIKDGFNLYLSAWGNATPVDERGIARWISKASQVHTEMSSVNR
jgi:hypothetical protein